jgi:hypothetical protein
MATETGFAVRGSNGGYFDSNGLGDLSLSGEPEHATIFDTVEQAAESLRACLREAGEDDTGLELVPVTRTVVFEVGLPVALDLAEVDE